MKKAIAGSVSVLAVGIVVVYSFYPDLLPQDKKVMEGATIKKNEVPTLHKMGLKATKSLPDAKRCLGGPEIGSLSDDHGMMTNNGLSSQQISKSMNKFFPQLSSCMPDVWPTANIEIDFNVGCNGLVSYVRIVRDDNLDFTIQECIEDAFQYAEFPAHDLPDGMDFSYPIQFEPG
jgi:hypothetical protein